MNTSFLFKGVAIVSTTVLGIYFMRRYSKEEITTKQDRINVLSDHFHLLNHWLEIKNEGKSTAFYFEEHGYSNIAIYGMADLANRLLEDLEESDITVSYGIDRDVCCSMGRIDEVYFPEDELPEADVIVVTPYSIFETIKKMLEEKVSCPIISLEEVIWSV